MKTPPLPSPNPLHPVLNQALLRLLRDEALGPFSEWFAHAMNDAAQAASPLPVHETADALRYQRHVARLLWAAMPVPSNRWRPRGLPKLDRNAPCHCGSNLKFKHCCTEFSSAEMPIDANSLLTLALAAAEPDMLDADKVRQIPAQALGMVAMDWNQAGLPEKTLEVLAPLFTQFKSLDARHEAAFDALMDAMQALGQERARRQLLEHMAQHPDKVLATAARCRLVSVLADQGEETAAWKLFQETSHFNPNDPQLWHLELVLLHTQGRPQEARLRGPLLAAQARKAGLHDLAGVLLELANEGLGAVGEAPLDDPITSEWLSLCSHVPKVANLEALAMLYRIDIQPASEASGAPASLSFRPQRKLTDLQRRWHHRFAVGKPEMTQLTGDADLLLDELPEVQTFLQKNPLAWLSIDVLDDLLLAARDLCDWETPGPILRAAREVARHALDVLRALVGHTPAQVHWADLHNRSALRVLALSIELARYAHDDQATEELTRWGLALNPHDNHGWRLLLTPMLIGQSRFEEALGLMAQYPDDFPPSEHLRALALFALGRVDEAEKVLRASHKAYPRYLDTLWPEALDPPKDDGAPGIALGGELGAWHHRVQCRATWVRSGALQWAAELQLPAPKTRTAKPRKPATVRRAQSPPSGLDTSSFDSFGPREEKQLRAAFTDYPRLHGLLQAIAWSPSMVMPSAWMPHVLTLQAVSATAKTEAQALKLMNASLGAAMQLYNHLNAAVLNTPPDALPPLESTLGTVSGAEQDVALWAAGFVQGAELSAAAWARTGNKLGSGTGPFGRIQALAARASLTRDGWRALQPDGQTLLLGLQEDAEPAIESLKLALSTLWRVVAPLRHKRAN